MTRPTRRTPFAAALLAAGLLASTAPAFAAGQVGDAAPAFTLKDAQGKTHSLADYKGKVVVLEWVNPNCPFSRRHAEEKTMSALAAKYASDVVWLGVNSTNPQHRDFLKPAAHLDFNQKNSVAYPVLYDESGQVGKAYDAKTTPHMFIIDPQGKIAYNGAIDDDPSGGKAAAQRANYVDGGLRAEKAGQDPDPATTKPYGCSVKY
jgi:peroxiredoxin